MNPQEAVNNDDLGRRGYKQVLPPTYVNAPER